MLTNRTMRIKSIYCFNWGQYKGVRIFYILYHVMKLAKDKISMYPLVN